MPPSAEVLEIGAGQGAISARLAERFAYVGVEADADAAAVARRRVTPRGGELLVGDARTVAPAGPFAVVCAFEVLEHIQDDAGALDDWYARLQPGGRLVLSVPAHQHRFGPWDVEVGHYRRYDPQVLIEVLARAGFERVDVRTYGFPLGYVLEWIRDQVARQRPSTSSGSPEEATARSGRTLQPSLALGAATWLVTRVFRWLQRPFARWNLGTGIVATAVRPER